MKINIPSQSRRIFQDNKNQFNGNISESFNLDLTSNRGKIGVNRAKRIDDFTALAGAEFTEGITAIGQSAFVPFVAGGGSSQSFFLGSGQNSFFSSSGNFIRQASSAGVDYQYSDFKFFNNVGYLSKSGSVEYSPILSSSWTTISGLTSNTMHLLEVFGNRLYVTDDNDKVVHVTSGNVLNTSGTATLDLNLTGYTITALMSGLDRIWIGVSSTNQSSSDTCYIYEWDGASENSPSQRYEIDASGIICGVVKDGRPYVLDTNGRLLVHQGASFVEVARLPYKEGQMMNGYALTTMDTRAIHPRAITAYGDEILINVSNLLEGSSTTEKFYADFPSGVWAYSPENGLYHKLSASYQAVSDTGTTNISDWGQMRVGQAGAIFVHDNKTTYQNEVGEGGKIIFSQKYFTDGDDNTTTSEIGTSYRTGLFADDTQNNTQKYGYFITTEIHTQDIEETWQKIYLKYKSLLDDEDTLVVKYRTEVDEPTETVITWDDIDRFSTQTDISSYVQGHDIQVIQGYGSGKAFTIDSISENAGTYTVIVKEPVQTNCYGQTSVAKFSNFINIGTVTKAQNSNQRGFTISNDNVSPMAQFKVCIQITGKSELYGTKIITKTNINE